MNRILVIRGGAIGDFILTLPALKALRDNHPSARIEILGYRHIAALAENRVYADAIRSIEYAALSGFFAKGGALHEELCSYFTGFDLVISYLFDPDGIFEANLRRSGVRRTICGPAKIQEHSHATRQLARPIQELGIQVSDFVPRVFPSAGDRRFAREFLEGAAGPVIALHVGSGSAKKNWPLGNWIDLGEHRMRAGGSLLVISGEADQPQRVALQERWRNRGARFATNLALPDLAAVLAQCLFIGHDSGISHLAAAVEARCLLLFGPTDPEIWAPPGKNVQVIRPASNRLEDLDCATVANAVGKLVQPL